MKSRAEEGNSFEEGSFLLPFFFILSCSNDFDSVRLVYCLGWIKAT